MRSMRDSDNDELVFLMEIFHSNICDRSSAEISVIFQDRFLEIVVKFRLSYFDFLVALDVN